MGKKLQTMAMESKQNVDAHEIIEKYRRALDRSCYVDMLHWIGSHLQC